jgi:hypothetical protein
MNKKFLKRLLYFVLILIAVNFILDHLFKNFTVHNILNNAKDKDFSEYNDSLKYLSMGNSHNTVNTYILDKAYNYNSPAENYVQSYYKLKSILEVQKRKPEYLILYIDNSSFGPKAMGYLEHNSYWIKYIDYAELAKIKSDNNIFNKWIEGKFISYAGGYRSIMLTLVYYFKIGHLDIHKGYRPPRNFKNFAFEKPANISTFSDESSYDWSGGTRVDQQEEIRRAKLKTSIYFSPNAYLDPSIASYFEMILKLCQEHDVKIILLRSPVTAPYWQEVNKLIPVDSLQQKVGNIYKRYPNVAKVLDYHDLYFDHPEYFYDADHLNPKGAELFTKQLKKDLGK